ncbi:MAG: hypothetical protein ACYC1E_02365 [Propionibacteriaceae bacterium]
MSGVEAPRRRPVLPGWMIFAIAAVVAIAAGGLTGRVIAARSGGTGPSDTVLRFFQAVRDNDAKTVLSELATPPADMTFVTHDVLATGHLGAGAITDISVPATSSTVVPVTYRLGGETITDRISVQPVGNGYKVSTTLNSGGIALKGRIRAELPLSIAGVPARNDTVVLLPGSYPLTTMTDNVRYGTGSLVVKRLTDTPTANDLKLELSESGQSAAATAVAASLTGCAGQKSFAPAGCPFKLSVPTADPSTVAWTLLSSPAADLDVTVSATDVTKSTVEVPLRMRISYADGTGVVSQELASVQAVGTIDLLSSPMTVIWTS